MKKSIAVIIIAICILAIGFTVFDGIIPVKYSINIGSTAPDDIYATREIVDTFTTEKMRAAAEESVEDQYVIDNSVTISAEQNLENLFKEIEKDRGDGIALYRNRYCRSLSKTEYEAFKQMITEIHEQIMNKGVTSTQEALKTAEEELKNLTRDEDAISAGMEIFSKTIAVNKEKSAEKTKEAIKAARDAVAEVVYKENQIIVRKGDIVNKAQYEVLSGLGLVKGKETLKIFQLIGVVLFMAAWTGVLYQYLKTCTSSEKLTINQIVMVSTIMAATILMTHMNKGAIVNPYMIPIGTCGILTAILIGPKFSVFIHTITAVIAAVVMGGNAYYLAVVIISGYVSIFLYTNISHRSKLVVVSLQHALIGAALFFATGLLQGMSLVESLKICGYGIINTALSAVIVLGFLPFFETFFDVATPFRLLDLSNPDNPLLSRLLKEAPGTYHHSLMVGNLAEAACDAIGGNGLLARVGAYYHDAGKLKSSGMFTENQYGVNPHDSLEPEESAKIIISHVRDGVEFMNEYKLPKAVKSITASHHGTTTVSYFLFKAKSKNENVDESLFRYPGPLPKTKEECVVMMADSVEAAVRSLDDKSESAIREMVTKIIKGKISDGQISNCPLTFAEIEKIGSSFIKVFGGYYHSRIKYPDKDSKD